MTSLRSMADAQRTLPQSKSSDQEPRVASLQTLLRDGAYEELTARLCETRTESPRAAEVRAPEPSRDEKLHSRLRDLHHHRAQPLVDNAESSVWAIDRDWMRPLAKAHRHLVELFQLLYDVATLELSTRMSTTAVDVLIEEVLPPTEELNYPLLHEFSSRHFISLGSSTGTIRQKTNWARSHLYRLRKSSAFLSNHTSAKQIDAMQRSGSPS